MVVGTYGLAYGYAALRPDRAAPFIAIGLIGKMLGPIGWVLTVRSGEWPVRTFTLVLFNDLVWWLPFALFLVDGTRIAGRVRDAAAPACAVLNAIAALAILAVLRPGTELVPDVAERAAYISSHALGWRAVFLSLLPVLLLGLGPDRGAVTQNTPGLTIQEEVEEFGGRQSIHEPSPPRA